MISKNWVDRLLNGRVWSADGNLEEPTPIQANQGLEYLKEVPPSWGLHNTIWQWQDLKTNWLFSQMKSLMAYGKSAPTAVNIDNPNLLRDAVVELINGEARLRTEADAEIVRARVVADNALRDEIGRLTGVRYEEDRAILENINLAISNLNQTTSDIEAERFRVDQDLYATFQREVASRDNIQKTFNARLNSRGILNWTAVTPFEYVVPDNVHFLKATGCGGGGGGAGYNAQADGSLSCGAGGGAAGTFEQTFAVTPRQRLLFVVGAAGTAGIAHHTLGGPGGNTAIYLLNAAGNGWNQFLVANGGGGAGWGDGSTSVGGSGARAFGGAEFIGGDGGEGQAGTMKGVGGHGGASFFGGGGRAGFGGGGPGKGWGSGGGGAYGRPGTSGNGGAGASGYLKIELNG